MPELPITQISFFFEFFSQLAEISYFPPLYYVVEAT